MPIISGAMHGVRTTLMSVRQAWCAKSNDYIGEEGRQLPHLSLLQGVKVLADQALLFPPLPAMKPLVRAPGEHPH